MTAGYSTSVFDVIDDHVKYQELAKISISAFEDNPLYYLTYPKGGSAEIEDYHCKTMIKFTEKDRVKTITVVDDSKDAQKIVAFAILFLGPKPQTQSMEPPVYSDFSFVRSLKNQEARCDDYEKDIKVHLMCVLPSYQRQGIGSTMLEKVLEIASFEKRGVFLKATPKGKGLYEKNGFQVMAEARVNLKEYKQGGFYVQSTMVKRG
ncbi:acyl-CoA N-acyltransferase [Leptodontidium sp. MPI-SDFR-AT-0119]|nr:acyl-CoA N-acyltransferase [Leptodontidium sp. MPI-SDFR-AT-0119]